MTSILDPFLNSCQKAPDRIALIDRDGTEIAYRALERQARALAALWRRKGLEPGRRVLVAAPVSIGLYRSLIAIWMAGCEAVFPEPFAGLSGLRHACGLLQPSAVVSTRAGRFLIPLIAGCLMRALSPAAKGEDAAPSELPSKVALYSFTSGSTGGPKCIPRNHAFMLSQSGAVSRLLASDRPETDLVWFPVFVLACLANGGTAVLADSPLKRPHAPDTQAIAAQCQRHGVTRLLAPPSVAGALAREPHMPQLSKVFTGGGPVMPHHFRSIGTYADEVVAVYGSTEAEPIAVLSSREVTPETLAAMQSGAGLLAGYPVDDLSVRIAENEIQVAGPHVVKTYLDPRQNAENKIHETGTIWHRTGDGGYLDAAGRLWLRGRLKGRIGDHWPLEIEAIARSWSGVAAAALTMNRGKPVIAIAGRDEFAAEWSKNAQRLGLPVKVIAKIPLDRRHASKIDYQRLARMTS